MAWRLGCERGRSNRGAVSYGDPAENYGSCADPAVSANGDWFVDAYACFEGAVTVDDHTLFWNDWMASCYEHDVRRDQGEIADTDVGSIHEGDIGVDEAGVADEDVFAIFPSHRRVEEALAKSTEGFPEHFASS